VSKEILMPKLFYFSEVVKFAIEKEIESIELYKNLAETSKNENMKQLFTKLMGEEKAHEAFYEEILNALNPEQSPGVTENEEYEAYVKELISVGRKVPKLNAEQVSDLKVAVNYALDRERDSIMFYTSIKNYLASTERKHIEIIIEEELRHMVILNALRKQLA
jgi:rubrerythrin